MAQPLSRQIGVEFRTHTSDQMYVTAILRGCASTMRTVPRGAMTSSVIQFARPERSRTGIQYPRKLELTIITIAADSIVKCRGIIVRLILLFFFLRYRTLDEVIILRVKIPGASIYNVCKIF